MMLLDYSLNYLIKKYEKNRLVKVEVIMLRIYECM